MFAVEDLIIPGEFIENTAWFIIGMSVCTLIFILRLNSGK